MRELNRNHVYSLKDLTSEEKQQLLEELRELDDSWVGGAPGLQLFSSKYLYFSNSGWFVSDEIYYTSKEIINAKELFYTLEDVAVMVDELTKEQKKHLESVFVGYTYFRKPYTKNKELISCNGNYKYEIAYDKFIELFGSKEKLTLENIQVDCRYLTNDQIDEIADVFKKDGYRIGSLFLMEEYCFIRENKGKYCLVTTKDKNKTKITYEKFIELFTTVTTESTQPHYDNTNGSIYKFCNDQKLNSWEFDIIKRVVRCRKKGQFKEDLQKTKDLIDLYLKEFENEK